MRRGGGEQMGIFAFLIGLIVLCLAGLWACLRTRALRKRAAFSYALGAVAIALACLPLSVVVTWWMSPFWNWLGGVAGVRLVNHAGPVLWCYLAVLALCVALLAGGGVFLLRLVLNRDAPGGRDGTEWPDDTFKRESVLAGVILMAHASFDRTLGHGLRYRDAFSHTHMGWIGCQGADKGAGTQGRVCSGLGLQEFLVLGESV